MNLEALLEQLETIEFAEADYSGEEASIDVVLREMVVLQKRAAKAGFRSSKASELASEKMRTLAERFEEQVARREQDLADERKRIGELMDERERLVEALIQIGDLLGSGDRAVKGHAASSTSEEPARVLLRELKKVLARSGLEPTASVGDRFDPQMHRAVDRIPQPDLEADLIAEVVKQGYRFKGEVVRTAKVVLAE